MATFSKRLSELMHENEVSSKELAVVIDVSVNTINDWKRGKFQINLSNAIKIANFFKCSLDFLVWRIEDDYDFSPKSCPPLSPFASSNERIQV
ncbi:MAG: helix-turn-helix transcriptional regulator [Firmicutes bacterium]|nr:helix-turn-helix transcriptional regulator [Bacillota bacterium]